MENPALAKRGNPETDLANLAASSINPEYATAVLKVQAVHLTRRCVMSLGMAAVVEQAVEAAGFASKNVQEHIWQMPARYVGSYAEADAASTLALFEKLNPILDRERTREAYRLEVALLPPVLERAGDDRAKAVTVLTHQLLADETLRQALVEPIIRNVAAGSIATVVHHRRGAG